jgi:hypothetical protein
MLRVPDAAKTDRQSTGSKPPSRKAFWLALGLRVVLLVWVVIFMLETASPIWRVISLVAFCLLSVSLGQQARQLTDRRL